MELLLILSVFSLIIQRGFCYEKCQPHIAIVGGGIGGASASHFLAELFGHNVKIDLYEANTIGGRLATIHMDQYDYEAGGSIIHSRNKYMQNFVKLFGLEHRPTDEARTGIWNGKDFVFEESNWEVISLGKLLYRYGLQPFTLNRYINTILNDFEKIYDLQDARKSFANVSALLAAMNPDFPKLTQISINDHLSKLGYKEELINELVKSTLVVNYGQDTNVHSFVGCVSLAAIGSDLWAVKGGNKRVPEHLIYKNGNVNVIPAYVRKIRNVQTDDTAKLYEVHYTNKGSTNISKSRYNIVIIAAPLTKDQRSPITFQGFPPKDFEFDGEYHATVATFVKGDLNQQYFSLENDIDNVLSCDPNATLISSLGRLSSVAGPSRDDRRAWKIFSNEPLKSTHIHDMLLNVEQVKEIDWKAYPQYSTNNRFDKFKLHEALYHVNAIEWAASAMEMSAIGGRNVAILAHEDFTRKCNAQSVEEVDKTTLRTTSSEL